MILGHAGRKMDVSHRYGFVDDYELVNAIDRFTYNNGTKSKIILIDVSVSGWCISKTLMICGA